MFHKGVKDKIHYSKGFLDYKFLFSIIFLHENPVFCVFFDFDKTTKIFLLTNIWLVRQPQFEIVVQIFTST